MKQYTTAGLQEVATRRFDDGEGGQRTGLGRFLPWNAPPRTTLYADLTSDWLTSIGRQRELKTGNRSFWEGIENDMSSANPKGG